MRGKMDRTLRGLLAGMIAAIPMNAWSLFSFYILGQTDLRLLDWGSYVVFGNLPQNALEVVGGQLAQIFWCGFIGVLFALLIPFLTSRHLLLKGIFYGFITGFFMYAIPVIISTPILGDPTTGRAISQAVAGMVWGASLAYAFDYLDEKKPSSL